MSDGTQAPTGDAVVEEDGKLYSEGAEITVDEARAKGWTPPAEAPTEPQAPDEADPEAKRAPTVLDRLRDAYASSQEGREKTIAIAPGIYHDLAAKYRPIDPDLRRKLQRRADRINSTGDEANLEFQATLLADACLSIMVRPAPGQEYVEAHTVPEIGALSHGEVIRYDRHLAAVLGIELIGDELQSHVARLVFRETPIFDVHYTEFSTWSTGLTPDDDEDDEEDEGGGRPT